MDNLRLALFVSLCFVLLLIWQAWQRDYGRPPAARLPAAAANATVPAMPAVTAASSAAAAAADTSTSRDAAGAAPKIQVHTDVFDVEISATGGDITKVSLRDYPVSLEQHDTPFVLLDDSAALTFIAQGGLLSDVAALTHRDGYQTGKPQYDLAAGAESLEVPLTWRSPKGVSVVKTYTFHRHSHLVEVSYHIDNGGSDTWKGRLYGQLQRRVEEEKKGIVYTYTGAAISSPDKRYEKIRFKDMADKPLDRDIHDGWAAMLQHYFVAALIPDPGAPYHFYSKVVEGNRYIIGMYGPEQVIAPGGSGMLRLHLYLGPKVQDVLKTMSPGLELTVDYGSLWFIAKPLFWLLQKIHGMTGNWGWSIILLTLLVKLMFYRLAAASYRSMANMRRVQPRLLSIRERYANDRARLNQAMMDLYKQEKINPLGGCLPIVVQIPVFLSLYWVLLESVELRQASFVLWIRDLSTADPYFVLPLLMGVTMFLQQKMNPAPVDPVQQKVMQFLPFVFTVFFAFFPSGLVLYWLVNNVLSIAQQWLITRSIEGARSAA